MAATEKTNVMRVLDQKKVPYLPHLSLIHISAMPMKSCT